MKKAHWLCKIFGHKFTKDEAGEMGYCERCDGHAFHDVEPTWLDNFDRHEGKWFFEVYYFIATLPCRIHGHDWEDDSYGNPDSGYMGVSCKRCGYSMGSQLY